jgi:hypothetical protein
MVTALPWRVRGATGVAGLHHRAMPAPPRFVRACPQAAAAIERLQYRKGRGLDAARPPRLRRAQPAVAPQRRWPARSLAVALEERARPQGELACTPASAGGGWEDVAGRPPGKAAGQGPSPAVGWRRDGPKAGVDGWVCAPRPSTSETLPTGRKRSRCPGVADFPQWHGPPFAPPIACRDHRRSSARRRVRTSRRRSGGRHRCSAAPLFAGEVACCDVGHRRLPVANVRLQGIRRAALDGRRDACRSSFVVPRAGVAYFCHRRHLGTHRGR